MRTRVVLWRTLQTIGGASGRTVANALSQGPVREDKVQKLASGLCRSAGEQIAPPVVALRSRTYSTVWIDPNP
jgi:hypothetical protein